MRSTCTRVFSTSLPCRVGCLVSMRVTTSWPVSTRVSSSRRRVSRCPRSGSLSGDSVSPGRSAMLPRGPVELLEPGELQRRHDALAVGGAVDPAVVHADQVVVGGEPHVALDPVGARARTPCGRPAGCVGLLVAGAAMGDDEAGADRSGGSGCPRRQRPLHDVHSRILTRPGPLPLDHREPSTLPVPRRRALARRRPARARPRARSGDDVAQQAWTQALAAYPRLTHARNLRSWLLTITHRCAMDHHRAARRTIPHEDPSLLAQAPTLPPPERPTATCGRGSVRCRPGSAMPSCSVSSATSTTARWRPRSAPRRA